jgi:signal transduction histidine kinase
MTGKIDLSRAYGSALRKHLSLGRRGSPETARKLGSEALAGGLSTLDLAKLHEQCLISDLLPSCTVSRRKALIRRAASFFGMVVAPIELTSNSQQTTVLRLKKSIAALGQRTVELAASNQELSLEISQRTAAETELRRSEQRYVLLLKQSDRQQVQLRQLSRQILLAQEDERKNISRELHDVIAQTLTGINIRLAALKNAAVLNSKDLDRDITRTQMLVLKSVDIIHQFARDLRPAVLDDLGLIPALHSFIKGIATRAGFRAHLAAGAEVESMQPSHRTVLFRVAQEALINVARHAQAQNVRVSLAVTGDAVSMIVHDDGRSFEVERVFAAAGSKRLGLIGMRERLEMVGGCLTLASIPGKGTTVTATIPMGQRQRRATPPAVRHNQKRGS